MDTVSSDTIFEIEARIPHIGRIAGMSLPAMTKGREIKDALLNDPQLGIPRVNSNGQPHEYKLSSKTSGREISDDKTLFECGVVNHDSLIMTPILDAG